MSGEQGKAPLVGTVRTADLGDDELTAELSITSEALVAETASGTFAVPLKRLQVSRLREGRWLFSDPEHEEWMILTAENDILREPVFRRLPHLVRQVRDLEASQAARRAVGLSVVFVIVFFGVVAVLLGLYPRLVNLAVRRIPADIEGGLGKDSAERLLKVVGVVDDRRLSEQLEAVTNRLGPALKKIGQPCSFTLLESRSVNAIALPGGRVFVCRGLMETVESGEELAGVIAHELAHVHLRHGLQEIVGAGGPLLVTKLAFGNQAAPVAGMLGGSQVLLGLNYSREHEREADETGFRFLVAANIDPRGLLDFFRRLERLESSVSEGRQPAPGRSSSATPNRLESVFSTHPLTSSRISHLEDLWKKLPRKTSYTPIKWSRRDGNR